MTTDVSSVRIRLSQSNSDSTRPAPTLPSIFSFIDDRHTAIWWEDFGHIHKILYYMLQWVFWNKLALVIAMRKQWPLYATYEEDVVLWKSSWNEILDPQKKQQIIMHDNTDFWLVKPSNPALQWALYSKYYCSCVGKGSIALQLCGWTVTLELCTGGMDNSAPIPRQSRNATGACTK